MSRPTKPTKLQVKPVRLVGGPLDGRIAVIPRADEELRIGAWWVYKYAGRLGMQECFAIVPRSRRARKYELWHILTHAMHPRVEKLQAHPTAPLPTGDPG